MRRGPCGVGYVRLTPRGRAGPRPQHGAAHNSCIPCAASGCGVLDPRFCRSYACRAPGVGSPSARNACGHPWPGGRPVGPVWAAHNSCITCAASGCGALRPWFCRSYARRAPRAACRAPGVGSPSARNAPGHPWPGGRPVGPVWAAHNSCTTCAASGCGALHPRFCRSCARRAGCRLGLRAAPPAGSGSAPSPAGPRHPPTHASRRIRAVTRVPNASASTGTRSSAAWNCPNTSKFAGTRRGTKP